VAILREDWQEHLRPKNEGINFEFALKKLWNF